MKNLFCRLDTKTIGFSGIEDMKRDWKILRFTDLQYLKSTCTWHSPYILVYIDPLLTYLLVYVPLFWPEGKQIISYFTLTETDSKSPKGMLGVF